MIDLGTTHRITVRVSDPAGELVDPETAELTVTLPDQTTETYDVELPPSETGIVTVDIPTEQAGRHSYVLSTTEPQTSYRDIFDVREGDTTLIVSLADTKKQLNISSHSYDEEIRGYVEAAGEVVEAYVGSVAVREHTERRRSRDGTILVNRPPVMSVERITNVDTGETITTDDITVDDFGYINSGTHGVLYDVTYTAGRAVVSGNITQAALLIVQHMWETQRVRDVRRAPTAIAGEFDRSGGEVRHSHFSIPLRAVELLQASSMAVVA